MPNLLKKLPCLLRNCQKALGGKRRFVTVGQDRFVSGTSREELIALLRDNPTNVTGYALVHRH